MAKIFPLINEIKNTRTELPNSVDFSHHYLETISLFHGVFPKQGEDKYQEQAVTIHKT